MATQAFVHRHRIQFGGIVTPTVVQSDFDEHKLVDGLGRDYWPLAYLDSDSQNVVLTNDGRALINAPLYMSLIVSATPIAGTGSITAFDKLAVLPTGCLVSGVINPAGVAMRVEAGGPISTKASSPGDITIALQVDDGTFTVNLATVYASALLASQTDRRWVLTGKMTVRATSVQPAAISYILPIDGAATVVMNSSGTSFNTALTPTVSVLVDWGTADAANSIGLDTLTVEIARPGGTVT